MADLRIRILERIYDIDPTLENAARLISAYRQINDPITNWSDIRHEITRLLSEDDFHDMNVLTYDMANLDVDSEERYDEIIDWINQVSSFHHNDLHIWERIVYIGLCHEGDVDVTQFARVRIGYPDMIVHMPPLLTPPELIPIIERALELGAWYVAFNAG